jgi:glycosyltransferase involved in cell wall biosynthesis
VPAISATFITFNEGARLEEALQSVSWADEIIVVDSGSTDGTIEIARRLATRVETRGWPGYAAQKNHAASLCAHDWILSLDADERVSHALADSLRTWRQSDPPEAGYRVARVSRYLGRWIRTTDWYPDWQLRLYDRRRGAWHAARVHESVRVNGAVGVLSGELQHYPYRDVSDHLRRIDQYTTLAALELRDRGRRASVASMLTQPPAAFLRNYILRRGIMDGRVGLIVSLLNSYYVLLKFVKLLELEQRTEVQAVSRKP